MQQLKQYLSERDISQADFAKSIGVSQPTVCDWINGNMNPSIDRLRQISRLTGLSVDQLLGGTTANTAQQAS